MTEKLSASSELSDRERPAGFNGAPRLTISILTKNSANRLERLLAQLSWLADQIVVGVDADSTDDTAQVAARWADDVFTFRHDGQMAAARMMIFDYAVGDWILVVDDDESLEAAFATLLPELMARPGATHFWFPRKWIVNEAPCEFAFSLPWHPDWQMRLFRNDRSLVWKPARPHSGYHVLGAGFFDPRAAILHFEPVWCSPEERQSKLARYRAAGAVAAADAQYPDTIGGPRRPAEGFVETGHDPRRSGGAVIHPEVRDAAASRRKGWGMQVLEVDIPDEVAAGRQVVARVKVRNSGDLSWAPEWSLRGAELSFSPHVRDAAGEVVVWDLERTPVLDITPPGGETTFLCAFHVPGEAGEYLIEWDMVSERECWFGMLGNGVPTLTPLRVIGSAAPGGPPPEAPNAAPDADRAFLAAVGARIPGGLNDYAALRTIDLMRWQSDRDVEGSVLVIGVHAGRYFSVLVREVVERGGMALGLEPFDRGDEASVRENLAAVGLETGFDLLRGRSVEHRVASLASRLDGPVRFISIDGSHLVEDVTHDLLVADGLLADYGVVACDDFLNPGRLGVGQAINAYLALGAGLVPFAYIQNKLFLCRKAAHRDFFEAMLRLCAADPQGDAGARFAEAALQDPQRNQAVLHGWDVVTAP
nr:MULTISPECIES: class I SAM-dependent methyltransferase [unclassified Caulobacter]